MSAVTAASREQLNEVLAGRYHLDEELGRGGMATVYRATDLRLDRTVAIKVFTRARRHVETSRFEREIRIAARLTHPQIVPLHDSGEAGGYLYYVMPLIEGESLRARLTREGKLRADEALRIAGAVAGALDYAHRQGYVHRDIKPENILLHESGALVADFGVALAIREAWGPDDELSTAPGFAVGTPAYMSPEQAAGERQLDGRTDQYALACVLFEMLAGRPPFTGMARQVMLRHVVEPPPSVRVDRPDVPWAVDGAILRAMAKEPAERFASATEWAAALLQSSGETEGTPRSATRRRAIAVLPFVNATNDPGNEYLSDGITDELISALANVAGLQVASRTSVYALKGRREDVRSIGALLGVGTVLEGTVRKAGSRIRLTAQLGDASDGRVLWSERFEREDHDIFALEDELTWTIVRTLKARLLGEIGEPVPRRYTDNPEAYNLYLKGRYAWNQRTGAAMNEAIGFFEQALEKDRDYALAWSGLADAYAIGVDYRNGPVAEGFERAKELARRAIALDDGLAEAHTSLAWVTFIHDWDWAAAERGFRRAIEANPNYASAHQWYAWLLASQGRIHEAVREGERAVALDPASVSVRRGLGWLHLYAREPAQAVEHARHALTMNPTAVETIQVLAAALLASGRAAEAEAVARDALRLEPEDTANMVLLARARLALGFREEAEAIRERMIAMEGKRYVSPTDRARIAIALALYDEAFEFAERCRLERRGWVVYMKVESLWDPVRSDPRYRKLLSAMGIPGA